MPQKTNNIVQDKATIPAKSWRQKLLALFIIVVIVSAGLYGARYLIKTKPQAKRNAPAKMETLVETMQLLPVNSNVQIEAYGNVVPAREIELLARVSGEVVYAHPQLLPGGIINAGETVVQLDKLDYELALKQNQNALAKAVADLRIEQGSQLIAEKEWELINKLSDDIDKASEDLALRKPQLAKVLSTIEAAKTDVEKAKLDLSRTEVKAPFNAIVKHKNISLGSQVSPQKPIATLISVESFWAELSVPMGKMPWITMPDKTNMSQEVTIYSSLNNNYQGKIVALLPDLDNEGLMARLLIEIKDPMGLKTQTPPLPLGSFIRAVINGKELTGIFKVPRPALHDGRNLLTISKNNTLHIQQVSVLWKDTDWAYIKNGLAPDLKIIVSNVATPIEGMAVTEKKDLAPPNTGQTPEKQSPSPKNTNPNRPDNSVRQQ